MSAEKPERGKFRDPHINEICADIDETGQPIVRIQGTTGEFPNVQEFDYILSGEDADIVTSAIATARQSIATAVPLPKR